VGPLLLVNVRDFRMRRVVQRNLDSRNVGLGSFARQWLAMFGGGVSERHLRRHIVNAFLPYRIGVASSSTFLQVRSIETGGYGSFGTLVDDS
jgi:hypothetical protein